MIDRVAAYLSREFYEEQFQMEQVPETYLTPQYNLARGTYATLLLMRDRRLRLERVRWGGLLGTQSFDPADREADASEIVQKRRALFPVNGFFIWSDDRENTQPFYVKRIDSDPIYIPAVIKTDSNGDQHFEILQQEANVLILPLTQHMPRAILQEKIPVWLNEAIPEKDALKRSEQEMGLSDLTVHRVSEDLNDPERNEEELLRPLPK